MSLCYDAVMRCGPCGLLNSAYLKDVKAARVLGADSCPPRVKLLWVCPNCREIATVFDSYLLETSAPRVIEPDISFFPEVRGGGGEIETALKNYMDFDQGPLKCKLKLQEEDGRKNVLLMIKMANFKQVWSWETK